MLKRECWLHVGEAKIYINIRRTLLRERETREGGLTISIRHSTHTVANYNRNSGT